MLGNWTWSVLNDFLVFQRVPTAALFETLFSIRTGRRTRRRLIDQDQIVALHDLILVDEPRSC